MNQINLPSGHLIGIHMKLVSFYINIAMRMDFIKHILI